MSTPSLLNIPYLYKAGTLYSQIPESGAGDFTVSRTTTVANRSTRINKDGLIETVLDNVPRLDYPLGGAVNGCPALLVEPAATNFARFVQQMTAQDTPTASGGMTITTGSTDFLAPDGTSGSINKYVGGAASGNSQYAYYTGGGIVVTAAGQHTFSLFVKAGATNPLNFCTLNFTAYSGGSGTATSYFSLASGTALTAGASIQDYGNGWYRIISAPYTIASGDLNGTLVFGMAEANNDNSWPASGALNLTAYTWGAQLEVGSVPTSYIPTTTAAVTRSGEVIRKTNITSLIGQSEGTVYFEIEVTAEARDRLFFTLDSASNSLIQGWVDSSRQVKMFIQNAGATVMTTLSSSALSIGYHKVAFAYNAATNGCEMFIDGVQNPVASRTVTGAGLPAFNNFTFGGFITSTTDVFKAHIRAGELHPNRIPNTAAPGVLSLATLTAL